MEQSNLKQKILEAAIKIAEANGTKTIVYPSRVLSKEKIAKRLGIATGSINYYWGTTRALVSAVMRHAVENENAAIIAWGLVDRHPVALNAPAALRSKAVKLLAA